MNNICTSFPCIATLVCAVLLLTKCSDDPIEPPPNGPDTTSHEFVWEVDTVSPEVYFDGDRFYGTSTTNVYLAGYSTDGRSKSWHWNGQGWERFDLFGKIGPIADIDGVDSTFIVFLGDGPGNPNLGLPNIAILDNGTVHTSMSIPNGERDRTCLHVVSRNEIYLGGVDGIQRYNGTDWEWLLDSTNSEIDGFGVRFGPIDVYSHSNNALEFTSQRNRNPEPVLYYLWRLIDGKFVVVDTFSNRQSDMGLIRFGWSFHTTKAGETLSGSNGGIYEWVQGQWIKIHSRPTVYLSGDKNNLFTSNNIDIWHYNGVSWKSLIEELKANYPEIKRIKALLYTDKTIFISATYGNNTVVFQGRQQSIN